MSELVEILKQELQDKEYREGYDEGFLDQRIATQIRVLRDQRKWSQSELGERAGMRQSRISTLEEPDYGSSSINTLRRLASAFDLRLIVSFEEWNTLLHDVEHASPQELSRRSFDDDPVLHGNVEATPPRPSLDDVLSVVTSVSLDYMPAVTAAATRMLTRQATALPGSIQLVTTTASRRVINV